MSRRFRTAVAAVTLMLVTLLVGLGGAEVVLRVAFPESRFLDRHRDEYWAARCREGLERYQPGQVAFGNVRLDARLGWRMNPGFRGEGETVNSRGLRGEREYALQPEEGCRVLVLGDSFTYGLGVRDRETYAAQLDGVLPNCEVMNAGANGWGTDQQYLFWLLEGRSYQPDVVVLGFYVPDFHRNALTVREFPKPWFALEGDQLVASPPPVSPPGEYCVSERFQDGPRSQLLELIGAALRRVRGGEEQGHFDHKAALASAILRDLKASTDAEGARLRVVLIPHEHGRAHEDHAEIEAVLELACDRNEIACLNLTEPLEAARVEAGVETFYGDNGHWTAEGHQHGAKLIAEFLQASE